MKSPSPAPILLMLTSYPPRPCGIATFSQDLLRSIRDAFGESYQLRIAALENQSQPLYQYPPEVLYRINTNSPKSIYQMGLEINSNHDIGLVILQHEFGLWGGEYGSMLKELLQILQKPLLTIFHTILPSPSEERKEMIGLIAQKSTDLIVMTHHASGILNSEYGISSEKITIIPHGTHPVAWRGQSFLKKKYKLKRHLVLSTFGLLGPNKNIETSIRALKELVPEFPNLKFLVLGQTHPELLKTQGESYRQGLEQLVIKLELSQHVEFVNRYLDLPELLEYLKLTDIYLFSSKDHNQAVSGTFAYALSCGSPVISTPIPHALETLDHETGAFFEFEDPEALVKAIRPILGNAALRKHMALNAYKKMRKTIWPNVAIQYQAIIQKALPAVEAKFTVPRLKLDHIKALTDHFGIIQFSKMEKPDINSGYTLDDNARALIAVSSYYAIYADDESLSLVERYLSFLHYCQTANGTFQNYVDADQNFHELNHYVNLEDSNGRAVWALGDFISKQAFFSLELVDHAEEALRNTLNWLPKTTSPRAIAFVIKGLYHYYQVRPANSIRSLILYLADKLLTYYYKCADESWCWFENYMTYANSILSEALLYAYAVSQNEQYNFIAQKSFHFYLSKVYQEGQFHIISNRGWLYKNQPRSTHGEQPIDVALTALTLDAFYQLLGDPLYKKLAHEAFSWFLGNNRIRQIIYDPVSGGCGDGLEAEGVNLNKGAESSICYFMVRLAIEDTPHKEVSNEGATPLPKMKSGQLDTPYR